MALDPLLIALDQGTSSSRCLAFNRKGQIICEKQESLACDFPRPGWVEQDPQAILSTQLNTLKACIKELGPKSDKVAAVGISNQRETTIIWDKITGKAIGPALVWQDRRTADYCEKLSNKLGAKKMLRERNGLVFDAYFSASKIIWLLDSIPEAKQRAEAGELAFGTVDSWLVYNLSGGQDHITDVTNASRSMLFNLKDCDWDDALLHFFSIPRALLPKVVTSSGQLSHIKSEFTGLERALPICAIAGDQQAALFGQACYDKGDAKITYGTGAFLLRNLGQEIRLSEHQLLTTVAWQLANEKPVYAYEGAVFIAGAAVQWLRDQLQMIDHAAEVEQLALSAKDNGGVYFVPSFTGLGAPHWDGFAQGQLMGIDRGTTRAQIARATLEGIAHQISDVFEAMGTPKIVRADGGAASNNLLLQIQADQLNAELMRPSNLEATAWGVALLAGLGCGVFESIEDIKKIPKDYKSFLPQASQTVIEKERETWKHAITCTTFWKQGKSS